MGNELTTTNSAIMALGGSSGFEGLDSGWFANQYIAIAQSQSKKVNKQSPDYIPGLEPGMFFMPGSKRVIGEKLDAIILGAWDSINEKDGKGMDANFIGRLTLADFRDKGLDKCERDGKYWVDENGHYYEQQKNFYVLLADEPEAGTFVMSLGATSFKSIKQFFTAAMNLRARTPEGKIVQVPLWAHVWSFQTAYTEDKEHDSSYFALGRAADCGEISDDLVDSVFSTFNHVQDVLRTGIAKVPESSESSDENAPF